LKLNHGEPLSSFALKFNLRCYTKATAKMLTQYTPPWKVEQEKMAAMRSLKASGQWPTPPPVPQVLAGTHSLRSPRRSPHSVPRRCSPRHQPSSTSCKPSFRD